MLKLIISLSCSYLLGSIPTAYLLGKFAKGIDLRQHGSGNLGATNAFRVLGKGIGTTVLILDILKGTLAVLLAKYIFYSQQTNISEYIFLCLTAIAVVSGHNWTIFLGFKGGKGVATSLGVLIGFSLIIERFVWIVVSIMILWLFIFLTSGLVSLSSVICSMILPFLAIIFSLPKEISIFLLLLGAFSLLRHKPNILRLLQQKENRFDTKSLLRKLSRKTFSQ